MKNNVPRNAKIGRPREGAIEAWKDRNGHTRYRARVLLQDGSYHRVPLASGTNRTKAKTLAAGLQSIEDSTHENWLAKQQAKGLTVHAETVDAWYMRFSESRRDQVTTVTKDRQRWRKYVSPSMGAVKMGEVDRSHVESVRNGLNQATQRGLINSKTANNVWGIVTLAMKEACSSDDASLRVRETNPCENVKGPRKRDDSRGRPFFYPNEIYRLLACEAVPLNFRRLVAILVYTYMRPGELAALTWRMFLLKREAFSSPMRLTGSQGQSRPRRRDEDDGGFLSIPTSCRFSRSCAARRANECGPTFERGTITMVGAWFGST
jgi:hypothetical protein